jgi:hypothetical protein
MDLWKDIKRKNLEDVGKDTNPERKGDIFKIYIKVDDWNAAV